MSSRWIVMMGTSLNAPGGMTSVVRTLVAGGLFKAGNVVYLPTYESKGIATQLRVFGVAMIRLVWMLMCGKVALVHVHSASRGSFWRKSIVSLLARLFGVPYVFQIHSGEFPTFYSRECGSLARWWVRTTLVRAAAVVCLTEYWRQQISEIAPDGQFVVIGNPVEIPALPPAREAVQSALFLGRLREKKGVFDLIRAVSLLDMSSVKFVLAGDEDAQAVQALANELGVNDLVSLPGWIDGAEKQSQLDAADLFVLPSYFEGLPVGILEAMANGIPIVTTSVGGIPDVVVDREHALLVPPGDPVKLAAAIRELATNQSLRLRLRENAYQRARDVFSIPVVVNKYLALYSTYLPVVQETRK